MGLELLNGAQMAHFVTLSSPPPKPDSNPHRRQSEPCSASSFSRVPFMTLFIVVINGNSEEDYVKSSKYLVQLIPEWPPHLPPGESWLQSLCR